MFEQHRQPLLHRRHFLRRLARHALIATGMIAGALALGVTGYHWVVGLAWIDALLNASMILAGMGPVDPVPSAVGKLFASAYAIFSGVAFLTTVGVLLAPAIHRFLHRFHLGA